MGKPVLLLLCFLACSCCLFMASASVVLMGDNVTMSFDDIEANFVVPVKGAGECGVLYVAEPLDACSNLSNEVVEIRNGNGNSSTSSSPFVLIVRGGCSFEDKVRRAQAAGFRAAIVYDDEDGGLLVAMSGNSAGISIHAVFVTKSSGETLKNYAGSPGTEIWIIPSYEDSAWSIMAISFISLLAMSAVMATCFFVRRHRIRRERPRSSRVREFHGMSKRLVKAMPSLNFTTVLEDNCTSMTCAICLEDYSVGEKLRILPCRHKFHAFCVDSWLTTWRTFCPVCKRDARTSTGEPPASESTPLLSSNASSFASSSVLSSFRSTTSSAIRIGQPSRSPSASHFPSYSGTTPYGQQSIGSCHQSPYSLSMSRSNADLRNMSSHRSSHLMSSYGGYPSISPMNARYLSLYNNPSPSNASPSLLAGGASTSLLAGGGSTSYQPSRPLHCSDSAASFSPFASTHSLPDC
ncbi:Receptor homology region, transmembrane domain-and RING domain-containing protein 2 [Linum grandiflorum]